MRTILDTCRTLILTTSRFHQRHQYFTTSSSSSSSLSLSLPLILQLSLLFNPAKSNSNYLHSYISYTYHWNIIPGQRYRQYEILVNTRDWAHWTGGIAKVSFLEEGYLFPDCLYFSLSFSLISLLRVKPEPIDTEIPTCLTRQSTRNPWTRRQLRTCQPVYGAMKTLGKSSSGPPNYTKRIIERSLDPSEGALTLGQFSTPSATETRGYSQFLHFQVTYQQN